MKFWWLVCLLIFAAAMSHAQGVFIPGLYQVIGVANDDRLNIRSAPDAASDSIGSLAPAASGVEVVALSGDGRWGRIGTGENSGWIAMRFLERIVLTEKEFETALSCFGTEPFWSLTFEGGLAHFSINGDAKTGMEVTGVQPRNHVSNSGFAFDLQEQGGDMTGFVTMGLCSDDMTDRLYGWHASVLTRSEDGLLAVLGCCTLQQTLPE